MDGRGDKQNSRVKPIAAVTTLGLLSAALAFSVEAIKPQLDEVKADVEGIGCIYPSNSGPTTLGILAAVALFSFRVYCPGIRSQSTMVQLARYLSWVAWFVAMIFYIVGLLMINNQGQDLEYRDNLDQSYYSCNVVKPGVFGAGASFALACIIFEIIYLVVAQHQNDNTVVQPSTQPSTVAMC